MTQRAVWRFNFVGWLLFTASAVAFIVAAVKAGDGAGLAASLLFLFGCIAFLVPVWINRPRGDG